jgi:ACT domain-containing protein
MTEDRKRIYAFIEENPNSSITEVVNALGLTRSQCYKYLSTDHFIASNVKTSLTQYKIFRLNDRQVVANHNVPRHHEIHQAFWGMR